nr:hypothetical protein [Candidatus Saccharicenans sp.]
MIGTIKAKMQPLGRVLSLLFVSVLLTWLCLVPLLQASPEQEAVKPLAPRPLEIKDILAWKSISSAQISADGKWFAYSLTPNEGD